jgi:hypothetical protein
MQGNYTRTKVKYINSGKYEAIKQMTDLSVKILTMFTGHAIKIANLKLKLTAEITDMKSVN